MTAWGRSEYNMEGMCGPYGMCHLEKKNEQRDSTAVTVGCVLISSLLLCAYKHYLISCVRDLMIVLY